jgi:HSP20 family protein
MKTQTQTSKLQTPETTGALSARPKQEAQEAGTHGGRWYEPDVDIYETAEALVLRADVPGAKADQIETDLKDNLLTITARTGGVSGPWRPLYTEFADGHWQRQFRLGQSIDQAGISAAVKDGVLTLTLPKAERARARKIQVKTA